jgi:hypothetical protein
MSVAHRFSSSVCSECRYAFKLDCCLLAFHLVRTEVLARRSSSRRCSANHPQADRVPWRAISTAAMYLDERLRRTYSMRVGRHVWGLDSPSVAAQERSGSLHQVSERCQCASKHIGGHARLIPRQVESAPRDLHRAAALAGPGAGAGGAPRRRVPSRRRLAGSARFALPLGAPGRCRRSMSSSRPAGGLRRGR